MQAECDMGEAIGGQQSSWRGRAINLCKFRKEVSDMVLTRIRAGDVDIGHMDISPEVRAQFVDNEDGLQLLRMIANNLGSVRAKTWIANMLKIDDLECELGMSATTLAGSGASDVVSELARQKAARAPVLDGGLRLLPARRPAVEAAHGHGDEGSRTTG